MNKKAPLPLIGWREWVSLPEIGVDHIKVKVDTGARSSSLHAFNLEFCKRRGREFVRFEVHPLQRNNKKLVEVSAEVQEYRNVKSSSGKATLRPVIVTEVELLGQSWPIELTLANRDDMGFRMLLGREAVKGRFLVNPGKSFYAGRLKQVKKK